MIEQGYIVKFTLSQANDYAWFLVALEKELEKSLIGVGSDFYSVKDKDLNGRF